MVDFKVRRGLHSTIFPEPGVINPKLLIEEGCWYLCTDTAELFLGVLLDTGELTLKRINDDQSSFGPAYGELDDLELFVRISGESELPTDFEAEDFNPNVTYYVPILDSDGLETGRVYTYIFDKGAQSYMCTNSVDEILVRAMVSEAIEKILDENFAAQLPEVIRQTISTTILRGGDATPEDD